MEAAVKDVSKCDGMMWITYEKEASQWKLWSPKAIFTEDYYKEIMVDKESCWQRFRLNVKSLDKVLLFKNGVVKAMVWQCWEEGIGVFISKKIMMDWSRIDRGKDYTTLERT